MEEKNPHKEFVTMVQEILDDFDFEKVHSVMNFLNWQWANLGHVPSVKDLEKEARRLLISLKGEPGIKGTGGLRVSLKQDGTLSLKCILTESWSDPYSE